MFIGHFAVGFAAKHAAPSISLGTFFLAAELADLVWPTLVLLGLEVVEIKPGITAVTPLDFVHFPYSHSLVALVVWGVLLGGGYMLVRRAGWKAGILLAAVVLSHWVLDVLTHRPDMPVSLTGPARLGLEVWSSVPATVALELAMLVAGVVLYNAATKPVDRIGSYGYWGLVGFLVVAYVASIFAGPPPSSTAVAWSAQALWLLVAWGYWVDRHRTARVEAKPVAHPLTPPGGAARAPDAVSPRPPRAQTPAPKAPPASAAAATGDARRVLVVDDHADGRTMLCTMLTLFGHETWEAGDGAECLRIAASAKPDVAIIDIVLPDLDGYEVARRLSADVATRGIALIALTGLGEQEERQRALEAGFDIFLAKPVNPDRLVEAIETARRLHSKK